MSDWLRRALARVSAYVRRSPQDREFNDELDAHVELATNDLIGRGVPPDEARRRALIALGGRDATVELHRDTRGLPWADRMMQDVRDAVRAARRAPAFTAIAVLILGLGIGANTAVFSLVDAVLFRPLPFQSADRLVWIENDNEGSQGDGLSARTTRVVVFEEWEQRTRTLEALTVFHAFFAFGTHALTGSGEPERLMGVAVADNFFPFLGVSPAAGRTFRPEEAELNGPRVVMLSHGFWQRRFGGSPDVIGRSLMIDAEPALVVGVTPASFDFGDTFAPGTTVDLFRPLPMDEVRPQGNVLAVIGRLAPGASLETAQQEFAGILETMRSDLPDLGDTYGARLTTLRDHVSGPLRASLGVLWAAVGVVLLVVCANVGSLLLARASTRRREMAVRAALGAGRARIARQLLTETAFLVGLGGILGIAIAYGTIEIVASSKVATLPLLSAVRLDGSALLFTLAIACGAALCCGLVPALQSSRVSLTGALRDDARGTAGSARQRLARSALVTAEIALAVLLVVGAGLLLRSFERVVSIDPGFQPAQAALVRLDARGRGETSVERSAFLLEAADRVRAVPGVTAAGLSETVPLARNYSWGVRRVGQTLAPGESQSAFIRRISPGYLDAMGISLLAGRDFDRGDHRESEHVAIVNQSLADRLWPGEDPIDQLVVSVGSEWRVVGLVPDVRHLTLEEASGMELYLAMTQSRPGSADLVVRSTRPLDSLAVDVRSALHALDPNLPMTDYRPVATLVERSLSSRRFLMQLITAFAALTLVLAALGIYGVISYTVSQQTQEIGIRMALGATTGSVRAGVLGSTLRLATTGIVLGLVAAFAAAPALRSMLFGVSATDPETFAGVAGILLAIALIAGYLPARRASKISPLLALRD